MRVVKLREFITIHAENWLSYYKTPAGDEGRLDNIHQLSLLAATPRAQLVTQLVSMGCRKKKEVRKSPRYDHFVATGNSSAPREDENERDRDRSHRAHMVISTVDLTDESGPSTGRRNDHQGNNRRDDSHGRDRSAHRPRSHSGTRGGDLRNIISPCREGGSSLGRGRGGRH